MAQSTRDSRTLHDACGRGRLRTVKEILMKSGDVVSLLESRLGFLGYTPLHAAACHGHDDILSLLLIYGGDVNTKANGDYTPLHVSASLGYVKCIEVLLKNNADIRALDDFHKTPYQTAIQHSRKDSAKTLKSAEIIQAAKDDPQELCNLLTETSAKNITKTCFNEALIEASHVGKFEAVCTLLVTGASNIKDCISISLKRGHYKVTVLLLICYAASQENISVLENLLEGNFENYDFLEEFVDNSLPKETVVGKIREYQQQSLEEYTRVAIQLFAEKKSVDVLKVLLLNTSCNKKNRKIDWSGLSLVEINESWVETISSWVEELDLSNNKLSSLPTRFVDLKCVVRLNLSSNKFKTVPPQVFNLVCLRVLNLSGNAINELPESLELRPILKSLNLSDNNLSNIPQSMSRSCLETLNLCRNNFTKIPLVICEITSLKYLDLSDNREIDHLPLQMGKLRNLTRLELKNLEQITDPPEKMRQNAEDLVSVLRRRLRACEPYYKMKMMLVGKGSQGKTTLVHRLQEDYAFRGNDLTQGVEISDLVIRGGAFHKDFTFKVWDFGGQEDYYVTHQCFLSTMSVYLLVWRLIDGEEGVNGLVPWLDNIAVRSPRSTVIIVGTFLDGISPDKHGPNYVDHLKYLVNNLVNKPRYKKRIHVPNEGIVAVSCFSKEGRAGINSLRHIVYNTAAGLKKGRGLVMGELIPFSYFGLIERIEKRRMEMLAKKQPPIIRREEFHAMVQENSQSCKRDIQDPHDVRDATVFLRERGILMHFDDPNKGLNELYFIDPRWLCSLMARVVTVKGHADIVKKGILEIENTRLLFKCSSDKGSGDDLPFEFHAQYIQLLVSFQIAYLLDETRILVPSKLPEKTPDVVDKMLLSFAPVRRAYRIDYQKLHGFWPRFMSRFFFYMKEMIAIDSSRYKKSDDAQHGCLAKFCRSCVRVENTESRFPCVLDDRQWEVVEDNKGEGDETEATSPVPSDSKVSRCVRSNHTKNSVRNEKKDDKMDDLQSLFLDPTVRLFTEDELGDQVDSMIINNVTTSFKKKESKPLEPSKKTKKRSTGAANAGSSTDQADSKPKRKTDVTDEKPGPKSQRRESPKLSEEKDEMRDCEEEQRNVHHKDSIASSGSFDSEQYDYRFSGSEQYPCSTASSVSELSSSFRSTLETNSLPGTAATGNEHDPSDASDIEHDCPETTNSSNGHNLTERTDANNDFPETVDGRDPYAEIVQDHSIDRSGSSPDSDLSSMNQDYPENGKLPDKFPVNDESFSEIKKDRTLSNNLAGTIDSSHVTNPGTTSTDVSNVIPRDDQSIHKDPDISLENNAKVTSTPSTDDDERNSLERSETDVNGSTSDVTNDITGSMPNDTNEVIGNNLNIIDDVFNITTDNPNNDTNVKTDITNNVTRTNCDVTDASNHIPNDQPQFLDSDSLNVSKNADPTCSTFSSQTNNTDHHQANISPPYLNDDQSVHNDTCSSTGQSDDGDSDSRPNRGDVALEQCTLCGENTPVDQLVTIPLDVAELIEEKFLQIWGSGIFLNHSEIFLIVSYRSLCDSVLVETAVSPSPLGRRLLTFVVDHLDTLIKEWYPGLEMSYGPEPTVQKYIPCRSCEKLGIPRPYKFTFDLCVTQYSMGDFVKCPRHEVSIQDITPDVVFHDIDKNLLLDENEIVYEKTEVNKIGKGNFGKVYRGRCRGRDAAIKEYSTPSTEEDALKRYCEVRKELNVLRRVGQHTYLVNLIGVCLRPFRLVLELAVEGSLDKTLFNKGFLIERVVIFRMIYQVADALSFLHSHNVIYRDLKPENVLVLSYDEKADINIKVTDFGTATFQNLEGLVALEGTTGYNAPEMLEEFCKRNNYDEKVDIFSLAMLIYAFITRRKPYYNFPSAAEVNQAITVGRKPDYNDVIISRIGLATLTSLMERCMEFEPNARPYSDAVANQVRSPPFQLLLGIIALPCSQSVRHVCFVEATRELWVAVDDKVTNRVLIYELDRMSVKKKFTVNRIRPEDNPVCMQVNCMHVTTTSVLIGLRGDLDVVTLHDLVTYDITAKIVLPEPVFCLSSNNQYIFLGMSSGVLRIVPTGSNGTPMTIEASDHPITCMVVVEKYLWLTAAKCIHIFHTEEEEGMRAFELNAVRFSSSRSACSHAVLSHDNTAVWCVSKGDSLVTGWDVAKRDKICEINCKSILMSITTSDEESLNPIEASVTCVLPVLDTVWIGTGGGMLLVLDARSGDLITWVRMLDDHVRTLSLVTGPGPCGTERCFVVASGKNVLEMALSRGGKVVCSPRKEMPVSSPVMTKISRKSPTRSKSPISTGQRSDTEDGAGDVPVSNCSLLMVFEALPGSVLRRIEAKSTANPMKI